MPSPYRRCCCRLPLPHLLLCNIFLVVQYKHFIATLYAIFIDFVAWETKTLHFIIKINFLSFRFLSFSGLNAVLNLYFLYHFFSSLLTFFLFCFIVCCDSRFACCSCCCYHLMVKTVALQLNNKIYLPHTFQLVKWSE